MERNRLLRVLSLAAFLVVRTASLARAEDPKFEIGTSLGSAMISLEKHGGSALGLPSGGLSIVNPGVYASFFAGPSVAIEPQVGLIWASGGGESEHLLNFAGQVDYFIRGVRSRSPYVFGSAGIVDVSHSNTTPKSIGGGIGYRILAGDRLTLRIDGRATHFTERIGNVLAFGVSIGGLFGPSR